MTYYCNVELHLSLACITEKGMFTVNIELIFCYGTLHLSLVQQTEDGRGQLQGYISFDVWLCCLQGFNMSPHSRSSFSPPRSIHQRSTQKGDPLSLFHHDPHTLTLPLALSILVGNQFRSDAARPH